MTDSTIEAPTASAAADPPPHPHAPRTASLQRLLVILMLSSLLPLLALGAAAIFWSVGTEQQRFESQLQVTARALALALDRQFGEVAATLDALATSPSLSSGDLAAFDAQAREVARTGQLVGLVDGQGRQRLNTGLPQESQARLASGADVVITNALAHVRSTIDARETLISGYFIGARTGQPLVMVTRRVVVAGEPLALTLGVPPRQLGAVLRDIEMPEGWVAAVLDQAMVTVARTRAEDQVVGRSATQPVKDLLARQDGGLIRGFVTADGMPSVVAVARAPRSGYAVAIAGPQPTGWRRLLSLFGPFAAMGLALIGVALAFSLGVGRRILAAVKRLGAEGDVAASGIREIDEVANRLQRSEAERTLLARELAHRIKNVFAVVNGLLAMAARSQPEHKAFAEDLSGRFAALAAATSQCRPDPDGRRSASSLHALLRTIVAPYESTSGPPSFVIEGEDATVAGGASNALALAFHEFATNAVKYGALAQGRPVRVETAMESGDLIVVWQEDGVAQPAPAAKGFGTTLTEATIVRQLGGRFKREWVADGLRIEVRVPLQSLATEE